MTPLKIKGEKPFQVTSAHSFAVSPSNEGYTLQYSADGISYTDWDEATPSGENLFVINVPKNTYYKLSGNASDVTVTF